MTPDRSSRRKQDPPLAYHRETGCYLNLWGDYDYLTTGYYLSQQAEDEGKPVRPTCKEILDAYITPLFLEKACLAGLPVPEYYVTNEYFDPPVLVDPINPFMSRYAVVWKTSAQVRAAKSLTRNFTYAICCQEIPPGGRVGHFRSVLGHCLTPRYRRLAQAVWEVFHIPLANVRVISLDNDGVLLSGVYPLPFRRLNRRELALIDKQVQWPT